MESEKERRKENEKERRCFIINTVLFVPLLILNFFAYGILGVVDMLNVYKRQAKEIFKKY